jgi:low temperature requirement protein LtrA
MEESEDVTGATGWLELFFDLVVVVIVVLGEAVLGVVNDVAAKGWTPGAEVTAVAGFAVAAATWWVYFDRGNRSLLGLRAAVAGAGVAATTVGPGAAAGVVLAALAWAAPVVGERVLLRPRTG